MDEYEEFMDKYVDFMKSYDANDVTMLSEYTELLSQYNTYMDKVSKIDEDSLSSADLAYYLDVTNRVNKKLLEVQHNLIKNKQAGRYSDCILSALLFLIM